MSEWLTQIGPYKVEKIPVPRAGGKVIRRNMTGTGVLHTAEGNSVEGMVSTLKAKGGAAYSFAVAPGRIIQLRALNDQSSALRGDQNRFAQVQICLVCSVPKTAKLWMPDESILDPLIHLLKWFSQSPENIPLIEPVPEWPSDWSDFKGKSWAINNHRRKQAGKSNRWPNVKGWFTHVEIPNQAPTWHHDCFAIMRKAILDSAAALPFVTAVFEGQKVKESAAHLDHQPEVSKPVESPDTPAAAPPSQVADTIVNAGTTEQPKPLPTGDVEVKKESPSLIGRMFAGIGGTITAIGVWFQSTGIDINAAIANGSAGKVFAVALAMLVKILPFIVIAALCFGVYYFAIWRAKKREEIAAKTAADPGQNSVTFKQ